MLRIFVTLLLVLSPVATSAAPERRDFCADRPGLGTPACTLDRGDVAVEIGIADWTREQDSATRTDTVLAGDALLRIGLTPSLEAQLGWTSYGHVRVRDRIAGSVQNTSRVGDASIALRQNLKNPDGSGVSIAIMPHIGIPVGRSPVGAGDWGAGVLLPMSFELPAGLSLAFSPGIDAAVDEDGKGRHLAFGGVAGLGFPVLDAVSGSIEISITRDRDPEAHSTAVLGGLSLGWQPSDDLQLDMGLNVGLNRDSADSEVYLGIARRF